MVTRTRAALLGLAGLVLAAAAVVWTHGGTQRLPVAAVVAPAAPRPAGDDLPRIDLARLEARREGMTAGKRDIFDWGPTPPPPQRATAEAPPAPPALVSATPVPVTAPTPPPIPPLNVKYIGSVEKQGLRVAILLTDRREVLTGQAGEVVANRFKIVKIGFESVDIQDLGSDRVRRIPYKGN